MPAPRRVYHVYNGQVSSLLAPYPRNSFSAVPFFVAPLPHPHLIEQNKGPPFSTTGTSATVGFKSRPNMRGVFNDRHSPGPEGSISPHVIKPLVIVSKNRLSSMNSVGSAQSHARSMSIVSLELPRNLIVSIDDNFRITRNNSTASLALLAGDEETRRKNYSAILLDDESEPEMPKKARHRLIHLKKDFQLRWKNIDPKMKTEPPKQRSPLELPRAVSPFASKLPAPLVSHVKPLSPYSSHIKPLSPYLGPKALSSSPGQVHAISPFGSYPRPQKLLLEAHGKGKHASDVFSALDHASLGEKDQTHLSYPEENTHFEGAQALKPLFDEKEVTTSILGATRPSNASMAHLKPILVPHLRTEKRAAHHTSEPLSIADLASHSNPTSPTQTPLQYLKKTRALASKNLPLYLKKRMIYSKDLQLELLGGPSSMKTESSPIEALVSETPTHLHPSRRILGPSETNHSETLPSLNTHQQNKLISQMNKKWNKSVTSKTYSEEEIAPPRPRKRTRRDLMFSDEEIISEVEDTSFNETTKDSKSTT